MFVCRLEKEGNVSFTMYEHGKGMNRAEEMILLKKFPSVRMFYYAYHSRDLTEWWNLENPETYFIPLRLEFCFVMKDTILKIKRMIFITVTKTCIISHLAKKNSSVPVAARSKA
jgi:hypothetical protein